MNSRLRYAYRTLEKLAKSDTSGNIAGITVSENFYIIQRAYSEARMQDDNRKIADVCRRYLNRNGWVLDRKTFYPYFSGTPMTIRDIYSIGSVLGACLIISAGEEAAAYRDGRRYNREKLIASVLSLRKLPDIRAEECFGKLCPTERRLSEVIEAYSSNDNDSKDACREAVVRYAEAHRLTEGEAVSELMRQGKSVYSLVTDRHGRAGLYFTLYALLFVCIAFPLVIYSVRQGNVPMIWASLLSLPPIYLACGSICDRLMSQAVRTRPPLRLKLDSVPDDAKVITVITTLLFGEKKDSAIFDNLEEFYLKNRSPNSYFAVLADLPDAKAETMPGDAEAIAYAIKRITALNGVYGDVFSLFIRSRTENGKVWGGKERKRGAVCALVKAICGEEEFAVTVNGGVLPGIRYILTLDSDTTLPPDGVTGLLSVALHPVNRPVIRGGRVVGGYGVYQPKMKTGLIPSYSTYYSLLRAEAGSFYETAGYDRYQTILGSGVFCGKGLIDVGLFRSLVLPVFPDGKILSHDIPEGCVLRCMHVQDISFCDSGPRDPVSYFKRLHRWIRGDVQNCIFLSGSKVGSDGVYKLTENLIRHLTPLFSAAGICVTAFSAGHSAGEAVILLLALQSYNASSAVLTLFGKLTARAYTPTRFFSVAFTSAIRSASNLFFETAAVFEYAARAADAFIRSGWRMLVSHRRLLQWVTFSQSDASSGGLLYHISSLMTSAVAGLLLVFFSYYPLFRFLGLAVFLCPLLSYSVSHKITRQSIRLTASQDKELAGYARDAFRFFDERVNADTNYLPPDNIQLSPSDVTAERTSPTNIGLYLLSLIAAHDMGFITADETVRRAELTVSSIEKLATWNGHLYNWYDIRSMSVIGDGYVSTVDSGNFVTMSLILREALAEFDAPAARTLAGRVERLADAADFRSLYDGEKKLFRLGYSEKNGLDTICYDLLMSEIRTTCYYACAKGAVPVSHWKALSRAVIAKDGFIGMASWSGTMFEYFMPELFLPTFGNSFIDESLSFAFHNQKEYRKNRVWGLSESGFYSFDSEMNYQYKAHGVPCLALKRYGGKEFVVSPYSSFIAVMRGPDAVLRNLRNLKAMGMYGEYGFYEALDLSFDGGGIVRSYMSHHTGMILVVCSNALNGGIFRERFMRDSEMRAYRELLCERIPTDVHLYPATDLRPEKQKQRADIYERSEAPLSSPEVCLVQSGNHSVAASSDGRIAMRCGCFCVNDADFTPFSPDTGVRFSFTDSNGTHICAPTDESRRFSFEKYGGAFAMISSDPDSPSLVKGSISADGKSFIFSTRSDRGKQTSVGMYFEPILERREAYYAHPAYSKLFVTSSYDSDEKVVIFRRRGSPKSGRYPVIGVALSQKSLSFGFRTDNEDLSAHSEVSAYALFERECDGKAGTCINPACLIKTSPVNGGEVSFIVAPAYTEAECVAAIVSARKGFKPCDGIYLTELSKDIISRSFFAQGTVSQTRLNASCLWKAGISGDFPLVTLSVFSECAPAVASFIAAFKRLAASFFRIELLFIVHEKGGYASPLKNFVKGEITDAGCDRFIGRRGGIFIAHEGLFTEDELTFIHAFSSYYCETDSPEAEAVPAVMPPKAVIRAARTSGTEKVSDGAADIRGCFPLPRSYILAGWPCVSVVTHKTLGFTAFGNARDKRITRFGGDPFAPVYGEELLIFAGGEAFDTVNLSLRAVFSGGCAEYEGSAGGSPYKISVYVMPKLPVKVITLGGEGHMLKSGFAATPEDKRVCFFPLAGGKALGFMSLESDSSFVSFLYSDGASYTSDRCEFLSGEKSGLHTAACATATGAETVYYLGAAPGKQAAERIIRILMSHKPDRKEADTFAMSFVPPFRLFTDNGLTNELYSFFAPYQTAFSRFIGKTGFYQNGGAYGFRDQLQDCLCLIYSKPHLVRTHIIRCACHQYVEGDVMHWWMRSGGSDRGVRTKCSDDMLFLPYVTADYIAKTGDLSLLGTVLTYLSSKPLESGERFESPERVSGDSLYSHCLRAIEYAAGRIGARGLCLMGSCDWNDGLSSAGRGGKGESVFTSLFLGLVCRDFAAVCRAYGDGESAKRLDDIRERMVKAVFTAYDGDRFPRGSFDDGRLFGTADSAECRIDIISQCFAAMLTGRNEYTVRAMNTAYDNLFDCEKGVFRLFTPAFDKTDAGYISAYPAGVRENGGQYTHGALWGVTGLAACGEYAKALEVFTKIIPSYHASSGVYKLEPYVIAADIMPSGRGGWSWYTGSAAWFYRIMTETVLGITFSDGFTRVSVSPLTAYTFIADTGKSRLKITASAGYSKEAPTLDGLPVTFPLLIPDGEHTLNVGIGTVDKMQ